MNVSAITISFQTSKMRVMVNKYPEDRPTISSFLKVFNKNNLFYKDKVQSIVMDKAFNKIQAVKTIFPNANIVICKFHILQAFLWKLS